MKVLEKENHTPEMITNSDKFPEGLRVLAVEDDPVCLRILQVLLVKCRYEVTVTKEAVDALKILRENKNNFDIVLIDVHMSDMDSFRLLEIIRLEMDIPVIMMSSNEDQATVMKQHGACDYLLKPIRLEVIKNIWQHVIRKSKLDNNDLNIGKGTIKVLTKGKKRPKDDENNVYSDENGSTRRKRRISWTPELHKEFIHACEKLGPYKADPSKILEEMNAPCYLTREQIASHLQKYRTVLKRTEGQQRNNRNGSNGMNEHLANAAVLSFNNRVVLGFSDRFEQLHLSSPGVVNSNGMSEHLANAAVLSFNNQVVLGFSDRFEQLHLSSPGVVNSNGMSEHRSSECCSFII